VRNRFLVVLIAMTAIVGASDASSAGTGTIDTFKQLGSSRHTLIEGIRHAEKLGGAAISAKFDVEQGKFWLSVYSAKAGIKTDAEHNKLIEFKGEANEPIFDPTPEVFQDVEHVARSATHLTLLQVATLSLEDAIKKASSVQNGTVYSAIPAAVEGRPVVAVAIATSEAKNIVVEVDLRTGMTEKK